MGSAGLKQDSPERILIVRLSAIGDCLHALPVVEEIRRQRPTARIGWLIQRGGLGLLRDYPAVDRFHVFERGLSGPAALASLASLRRELRAENYDVALDLQGLTKSGVLARLSGARSVRGFGAPESRELNRCFVRQRMRIPSEVQHVVDRNLALLPSLGLEVPDRPSWKLPAVDLGTSEVGSFLQNLTPGRPLAVINPGTMWPTKVWAQERFAEVAVAIARRMDVVVTWAGSAEAAMAERIVRLADRPVNDSVVGDSGGGDSGSSEARGEEGAGRVWKAPPTSLSELCGLIQRARVVVANDSGPLHLAVAAGVPAVGVYGPTDPARNGPYGWQDSSWPSEAVTLADLAPKDLDGESVGGGRLLDCQFCWKTRCRRGDTACLAELGSAVVIERASNATRWQEP